MKEKGDVDLDKATDVMKRYVNEYPGANSFLKLGKWAEYEAKVSINRLDPSIIFLYLYHCQYDAHCIFHTLLSRIYHSLERCTRVH